MKTIYPDATWERSSPESVGMKIDRVEEARKRFTETMGDRPGRLVVVRSGRVVLEHSQGMTAHERPAIASAAKSIYSNVLGVLVSEGRPTSADELVVESYPEMMAVQEGQGNKPGRHAFEANRDITFRHLITNVSGYMKPGETPGKVFNYQSWGMNVLTHALAKLHGLYDVAQPESLPGFGALIESRIGAPIGASWEYSSGNPKPGDRLHPGARLDVFGYFTNVKSTALDLARLGWLWCNRGRWRESQIVPEAWMRETTVVAPDILANSPREEWMYGHGFWTNSEGVLWPDLPRSAFTSSGAGGHFVTVFPEAALVVVQNPGKEFAGNRQELASPELLTILLEACRK